jgi:uracil-DNA glycosylase
VTGARRQRSLSADAAAVARRLRLEVDREAYAAAGRDPREPILFAGELGARVCVLGRDLGRTEVVHAQPQVGPSGRAVRLGILRAAREPPSPDDPLLERALRYALLANLVPYKPPGNRPFSKPVCEAFRPSLERLLVCGFRGDRVLALGREAFAWFARYADPAPVARCRFGAEIACAITARCGGRRVRRVFVVCALPHPSPANALYKARFCSLLCRALKPVALYNSDLARGRRPCSHG